MLQGHALKKAVLETIYDRFEEWTQPFAFACRRGCAFCCTQNVTATAVEVRILSDYIVAENMQQWLLTKLEAGLPDSKASLTTNQFAERCLAGEDPQVEEGAFDAVCPFLENDLCMVYPVRPFSCRCFASATVCRKGGSAVVAPVYLSAATAVSQLIEHLDQFNIWGNILHVLYVHGSEAGLIDSSRNVKMLAKARECCTTAQPLPGFLFDESEAEQIVPLIESIFASTVAGRSIEDILNNR